MTYQRAHRQTGQRIHHDSKRIGTVEAELWKPCEEGDKDDALEAARLYEIKYKRKGRRNGPIGHVGLEILEALWNVVDYSTGRLEPSLEWLMDKTGRCRDAVVTALKRLDANGFVKWIRRFRYTGRMGWRGPQVEQASNAYALSTPAAAGVLLPERPERTTVRGITADDLVRATAAFFASDLRAREASLRYYRDDHFKDSDSPLQKALDFLAQGVARREARRRSLNESLSRRSNSDSEIY